MSMLWIFSVHLCQLPQKASTEVHSFPSIYVGVEQCGRAVVFVCVLSSVLESDTV